MNVSSKTIDSIQRKVSRITLLTGYIILFLLIYEKVPFVIEGHHSFLYVFGMGLYDIPKVYFLFSAGVILGSFLGITSGRRVRRAMMIDPAAPCDNDGETRTFLHGLFHALLSLVGYIFLSYNSMSTTQSRIMATAWIAITLYAWFVAIAAFTPREAILIAHKKTSAKASAS